MIKKTVEISMYSFNLRFFFLGELTEYRRNYRISETFTTNISQRDPEENVQNEYIRIQAHIRTHIYLKKKKK